MWMRFLRPTSYAKVWRVPRLQYPRNDTEVVSSVTYYPDSRHLQAQSKKSMQVTLPKRHGSLSYQFLYYGDTKFDSAASILANYMP